MPDVDAYPLYRAMVEGFAALGAAICRRRPGSARRSSSASSLTRPTSGDTS